MESIPDNKTPLLIVDDDTGLLLSIKTVLISSGMPEPALVSDSRRVMKLLDRQRFHVVLLDLIMPHLSGIEVLKQIKQKHQEIECIILTAVDDVATAIDAVRAGAYDYLTKPFDKEKLIVTINHALEKYRIRFGLGPVAARHSFADLKHPEAFVDMVAEDEKMARIFHQAEIAAVTDYNLFLTGETGTGKELLARAVHNLSPRSNNPFVAVNVGASSKTLFESDFFGHTKEAFTGAGKEKKGFFETADGGTIFLDEITELDHELQGKLLRVIQEKELYPLGESRPRSIDVRIISATNQNVDDLIENQSLREDLFYRLNTFHIHIPPLRERTKDILPLAQHYLKIHGQKYQKQIKAIAPALAEQLTGHDFAGNVRELQNIIASAALIEKSDTLTVDSVRDWLAAGAYKPLQTPDLLPLKEMEKRHILRVLEAAGGNRTQAAKILGIGLRTLQRKLKAFENNAA